MHTYVLTLFVIIYSFPQLLMAHEHNNRDVIDVFSRESLPDYHGMTPFLSTEEWLWLKKKDNLVLAVPLPDNPPMDITQRSKSYEGVTADIIGILKASLGVNVVVKTYSSREKAIEAVKNEDADFIGSANSYEVGEGLLLTHPYIMDEPAIYKGFGVNNDELKKVAIPESYLPLSEVIRYLPGKKVEIYPSRYAAVAAVAYGKADAVLIDMISGNFIVNKFYQDRIQLVRPIYSDTGGFSFAVKFDNSMLINILNAALVSVSEMHTSSVIKRWSGGGLSIQSARARLSMQEWQLLNDKGSISIAVNTGLPPLSFIDVQGNLHGMAADLFQIIGSKLGIKIEVLPFPSMSEQIDAVASGSADLMIMSSSEDRRKKFIFSRSFALDPLVYVINLKNRGVDPETLLRIGRVAQIKEFVPYVKSENAKAGNTVSFTKVDNALACVERDLCDVIVLPLRIAKFFVSSEYSETLFIAGELFESTPIGASFAALPSQKPLINILSQVLSSIPPDELESLATRWRVSAKKELITWQDVLNEFGLTISITLFIFLCGGLWSLSLRRQIKHRNKAEHALGSQLRFIEELVDSTPHPIYARDSSGCLILCNSSYAKFIGVEKKELLGSNISDAERRWPHFSVLGDIFRKTLEDGGVRNEDHHIQLADREVDIYHWLQVYRGLSGEVQGVVGGWIDVSERAALVRELAEASQEAQEANRAKTTFLATMSHEIRTPMNAIIGLLELALKRGRLHEEDQSSLTIAHGSAKDLLSLIGDILDISKIESGRLELAPEPHDIAALTASVVTVFNALAREKNLRLELITGQAHWVQIDGLCYKQILSNLISNAIKYTEQGSVKVTLALQASDGWCTLQLVIRDTGIGIDPVEQARLFQPFRQASQPEHIQQSGTGLGLMISRTLCESMGGSLLLESEPGHGTRVCVEMKLPLADAVVVPAAPTQGRVMEQGRRLRVMVVDDHPANRLLVTQQLAYLGHDATAVESGEQALRLLADTRVDVVITDFNMPGMNGFELTRQCRAQERRHGWRPCVILGLTADARQEQINEGQAAGMNDCLFKPVGLEVLDHCLCLHLQREERVDVAACMQEIRQYLGPLTAHQSSLMSPLLAEFVRASDDDLLALQSAAERGAVAQFLDNVHRLKGGVRIMGTQQLVATCSEIESWDLDERTLPVALARLRQDYEVVRLAATQLQSVE